MEVLVDNFGSKQENPISLNALSALGCEFHVERHRELTSDVNKDLTFKAKDQDKD